jgi:ribosomal protein L7/L12
MYKVRVDIFQDHGSCIDEILEKKIQELLDSGIGWSDIKVSPSAFIQGTTTQVLIVLTYRECDLSKDEREVFEILKSGKKIAAIKAHRTYTGSSLKEAKAFCDDMIATSPTLTEIYSKKEV